MISKAVIIALIIIMLFYSSTNNAIYKNPIDTKLINAIIQVESSGRTNVINKKGCYGLMQVRYTVWRKELKKRGIIKTEKCLLNPSKNIIAGTYILTKYYYQSGYNLEKALIKYSGGSKVYAKKVMAILDK